MKWNSKVNLGVSSKLYGANAIIIVSTTVLYCAVFRLLTGSKDWVIFYIHLLVDKKINNNNNEA